MQIAGVREGAPGIRGTMWGSMNELKIRVSSDRRPPPAAAAAGSDKKNKRTNFRRCADQLRKT